MIDILYAVLIFLVLALAQGIANKLSPESPPSCGIKETDTTYMKLNFQSLIKEINDVKNINQNLLDEMKVIQKELQLFKENKNEKF